MSEIFKKFLGASFEYEKQVYHVQEAYRKDWKNHIVTAKRRFVYDDSQLEDFIEKIKFVHSVMPSKINSKDDSLHLSQTQTITDGMMAIFNELKSQDKPSENLLKKAKAMSSIAGVIVNTARLEMEFMKLKKDL
jgi:hypothetical protein